MAGVFSGSNGHEPFTRRASTRRVGGAVLGAHRQNFLVPRGPAGPFCSPSLCENRAVKESTAVQPGP
jgi:hypothetical protein